MLGPACAVGCGLDAAATTDELPGKSKATDSLVFFLTRDRDTAKQWASLTAYLRDLPLETDANERDQSDGWDYNGLENICIKAGTDEMPITPSMQLRCAMWFLASRIDDLGLVVLSQKPPTEGCAEAALHRWLVRQDKYESLLQQLAFSALGSSEPYLPESSRELAEWLSEGDLHHELKGLFIPSEFSPIDGNSYGKAGFYQNAVRGFGDQNAVRGFLKDNRSKVLEIRKITEGSTMNGVIAPWNVAIWNARMYFDKGLVDAAKARTKSNPFLITNNGAHRQLSVTVPLLGLLKALNQLGKAPVIDQAISKPKGQTTARAATTN